MKSGTFRCVVPRCVYSTIILICIIHTVTTQLCCQCVINYYIGYNCMFRPWVWAIIRLSLDLSSNYTISRVYGGCGVVGGTRSRLCNSGWYNLELYNNFTIISPLNNSSSLKYGKINFLNREICHSIVISICSNNILVLTVLIINSTF